MPITTEFSLLKRRRTKIVATVGPATGDAKALERLIEAGVAVFRLNMSHGDRDFHRRTYRRIREAAARRGTTVAVLVDLCGPRIRTGAFRDGGIRLREGENATVTTRQVTGAPGLIPSQYQRLAADVRPGSRIMLKDGLLELEVRAVSGTEIECAVTRGGELRDHNGINIPGATVSAPCITAKDREDACFALEAGADFLALSFVRRAEDIEQLRALVRKQGGKTGIIAKIERAPALENADSILDSADGIMVARGDLGVELLPEQVPMAQNELIRRARRKCKSVIVATQMLESMIRSARPTRAEVSDVAHAVNEGADALMLSGETAIGEYPVEAVRIMDRIARQTEAHLWRQGDVDNPFLVAPGERARIGDAIAHITAMLARDLKVHAIVVLSRTGMSAATMSAVRPAAPILAIAGDAQVRRQMVLHWGIIPLEIEPEETADAVALTRRLAQEQSLADPGDFVLLVQGFQSDPKSSAPSVTAVMV